MGFEMGNILFVTWIRTSCQTFSTEVDFPGVIERLFLFCIIIFVLNGKENSNNIKLQKKV